MSLSQAPFQRNLSVVRLADEQRNAQKAIKPENEVVRLGEEIFQRSKSYRDEELKMTPRWQSNRAWYLGTGTPGFITPGTGTHVNLIYEKTEKLTADLTESDPTWNYRPTQPSDIPFSEMLNLVAPRVWDLSRGSKLYRDTQKANVIFGNWIHKVTHDPGYGEAPARIRVDGIPPWYFFIAPYATCIEDSPWVIQVQPRTVEEIFNDYGKKVLPEVEPLLDMPEVEDDLAGIQSNSIFGSRPNPTDTSNTDGNILLFPTSFMSGQHKRTGIVFQKELWLKDSTTQGKFWREETREGLKLVHGKDLKFPKGRVISWANGVQLYDEEAPYPDGTPYVDFVNGSFPDFFWGLGEIPNLVPLQLIHDDTLDNMRMMHAYMAIGRLIIDESTGLSDRKLGNEAGEIWRVRRGTSDRVKWIPGLTPPAEFYQHLSSVERWFDTITGSPDVSRGINPTGVTAARALVALQRAAGGRVRGRLKETEDSMKRVGKKIAARVQQFHPTFSTMRLPDNSFKNFTLTDDDRKAPIDLKVDVISNLDDLRALEFQNMLLLFQMGLVSRERLVKSSGLSQSEAILAELNQMADTQGLLPGDAASSNNAAQKNIGRSFQTGIQ